MLSTFDWRPTRVFAEDATRGKPTLCSKTPVDAKGYAVANQRRQGYLAAMAKHSLLVDDDWIIDVPLTPEGGRNAVRAIFDMKPRATAVVCYNDQVAIGVLHEHDRMGKRAGKALAVVGCDNVVAAEHINPPLTALCAGADKLGTIASETLLARLSETAEAEKPPVQYFAVPELVVRESSVGAGHLAPTRG